jgi:hypothetical protein
MARRGFATFCVLTERPVELFYFHRVYCRWVTGRKFPRVALQKMSKVEQVFIPVSAQGGPLVPAAWSCGVLPIDLEEILESTKSLSVPHARHFDLLNLFFHHLPSGAYAMGRLLPSAKNRRLKLTEIKEFYLQYMIVPPDLFLRFGNNPVLLYHAILRQGGLPFAAKPVGAVEPILVERSRKWFDIPLLRWGVTYPGVVPLAKLADTVLHSLSTTFTGGPQPLYVISALFNLFPIRFRPELTFSSSLFFEPSRYFRVIGFSEKQRSGAETRNFFPVPHLNLDNLILQTRETFPEHGWQRFIREVLGSGNFDFFQSRLMSYDHDYAEKIQREVPLVPSADELDRLGTRWLAAMNKSDAARGKTRPNLSQSEKLDEPEQTSGQETAEEKETKRIFRLRRSGEPIQPPPKISEKLRRWLLSNDPEEGVHFFRDTPPAVSFRTPLVVRTGRNPLFSPFQRLLAVYPEAEKDLRTIDEMVAAVLDGQSEALDRLTRFWQGYIAKNDEDHKWRICEEYTHFIQIFITETGENNSLGMFEESTAALDLLNLFLNEGEAAEFLFETD